MAALPKSCSAKRSYLLKLGFYFIFYLPCCQVTAQRGTVKLLCRNCTEMRRVLKLNTALPKYLFTFVTYGWILPLIQLQYVLIATTSQILRLLHYTTVSSPPFTKKHTLNLLEEPIYYSLYLQDCAKKF